MRSIIKDKKNARQAREIFSAVLVSGQLLAALPSRRLLATVHFVEIFPAFAATCIRL